MTGRRRFPRTMCTVSSHKVASRTLLVIALVCVGAGKVAAQPQSDPSVANRLDSVVSTRRTAIVRAVETSAPAVVSIAAEQVRYYREVVPLFDFDSLFPFEMPGLSRPRAQLVSSLSSGVLFSDDGLVLTNEHGVPENAVLTVTLPDGREVKGDDVEVVGKDYDSDIAVLKINLDAVPAAPLGRSADLMIGEWVIAIGNPFGYILGDPKPSVSVGVVSALDRWFGGAGGERRVYRNMIQTDASINQGNSGGPLVNADGRVVGINTFILSRSGESIGLGFAIPIDRARRVADELVAYGRVRPIDLGFSVGSVDKGIAQMLGLSRTSGVVVVELLDSGAAGRAGMSVGDLIYEVNGHSTNSIEDARMVFRSLLVGDEVTVKAERSGKDISFRFDITDITGLK
jgi:serine protease Do